MEKMRKELVIVVLVMAAALGLVWPARAEDCEAIKTNSGDYYNCLGRQIEELSKQVEMSRAATAPLESEVARLDASIKSLQNKIKAAAAKQKQLEKEVAEREMKMAEHYVIFARKTRELYKKLREKTVLVELLSSVGSGQFNREIAYQTTASDLDRQLILGLSVEIIQLEEDKKNLEVQKTQLAALQVNLDKQAEFFRKEIASAKAYQADISGKIAALSAKQQAILAEKQGTFSTTVGDVPLADDPNARPDYNPGFSPAFAAFSFGAPHFKGMSQYGAFGRAKAGQSAEEILRVYYGGVEIKKDYPTGTRIKVSGYGTFDIESYTKRIYEMPGSWGDEGGMEALKAQAVAARSYALAYTDEGQGSSICTTEACQVFKNAEKGGKWNEAVEATRGWVLYVNGKPFSAWYASTAGGYLQSYTNNGHTTPGFWDTSSGRGGWTSQAYEKTAGSPWFYKGWYKSRSGASCGRSHPWLTGEEMADILNAWVVLIKNNQSDERIVPSDGCGGGNPYSLADLRSKAAGMGGGYGSVSGVSVSYSDGGYTANVRFETDKGGVEMSGDDFKKAFNLRAPGWISLKSRLFNIEKK